MQAPRLVNGPVGRTVLDHLDGKPRFHPEPDWPYRRLEGTARSMCEGISVWVREMRRPAGERSPTVLAHEAERARRMADHFEERVAADPLLQGQPNMAQLVLSASLDFARANAMGDFTESRPRLAAWQARISALPSVRATL